jgi:hypothetical protein
MNVKDIPFNSDQINQIAYLTNILFRQYIAKYQSPRRLTEKWVKKKGQDLFWRGLGYNKGRGEFSDFKIIPRQAPDGGYYIGWFDFFVEDHFKIAADRFSDRMLLPDGSRSFNENGTPTEAFCSFITSLAEKAAVDYGYVK